MGEYRGYFPDGPDGTIVFIDVRHTNTPTATELQERLSRIFGIQETPLEEQHVGNDQGVNNV